MIFAEICVQPVIDPPEDVLLVLRCVPSAVDCLHAVGARVYVDLVIEDTVQLNQVGI